MTIITWFKVDDNLAFHHKTVAAGVSAMGLWVRAGSWCSHTLTNGFVPEHMVPALADGDVGLAGRLVEAGLWRRVKGGYTFHEWADRNPSRDSVEDLRKTRASAGRNGGLKSGEVRRGARSKPEASASSKPQANGEAKVNGWLEPRPVPTQPQPQNPTSKTCAPPSANDHDQPTLIGAPLPAAAAAVPINRKADETFTRFWTAYPRKKSKQDARKTWDRVIKTTNSEVIIVAAQRFTASQPDLKYTPYPATWLNRGCWEDEPDPTNRNGYVGYQDPTDHSGYFKGLLPS